MRQMIEEFGMRRLVSGEAKVIRGTHQATAEEVHLHLTGTCAGCPGASHTRDGVIAPAIRTVASKARVVVTTGPRVPDGAKRI